MEVNFELYRLFCVVAECESFSKAAEKLYISQPAITQSIHKLEEILKGKLFIRTAKGIKLTTEGKKLYKYLKTSVAIMNNAEKQFSQYINLEEGEIKVKVGTALGDSGIYDDIIQFSKQYPNIKVKVFGGEYKKEPLESLKDGSVDLIAVNLPFPYHYPNIQIIECKKIEDCFFASKEYYQKIKNKEQLKEALKTDMIAPFNFTPKGKALQSVCKKLNIEYDPKYIVGNTSARKYFAMQGLGVGFGVKSAIKRELELGELVEIKVSKEPFIRKLGVAVPSKELLNHATLKLIEIIKKI